MSKYIFEWSMHIIVDGDTEQEAIDNAVEWFDTHLSWPQELSDFTSVSIVDAIEIPKED